LLINDYPKSFPIKRITDQGKGMKSFEIDAQIGICPGQFVMVWIPGYDEKPYALTGCGKTVKITVRKRGPFTEKLFTLKKGDLLGLRGPYGHGFSMDRVKKACVVAGGIGSAALILLAEGLAAMGTKIDFVHGCRCKDDVLFADRIKKIGSHHIATEDGSRGTKGYCTVILEELLAKNKYDMLYCCGPEMMMKAILKQCNKFDVPAQFAVERYMKCGIGICGHCSLDDSLCCVDGPVFNREKLNKSKEFGVVWHEKTGKKSKI